MVDVQQAAWPEPLYAAPVLRGLDASGRRAVEDAGRLRLLGAGRSIYAAGELADSFFVVERGEVELRASGRGLDSGESVVVRVARAGETFGEEATLAHARRLYAAITRSDAQVAEIPAALFRRALGRSGRDERDGPEHRLLRRRFTADLLRGIAFVRALAEPDFELLLDAAIEHEFERGERIFAVGDPPDGLWLIAHGLVQLQRETDEGKIQVSAYLSDGDLFGDAELLANRPRAHAAVAMGACRLLRISPAGFRQLADRNPHLLTSLRRVTEQRASHQAAVVEQAPHSTRHVFADLYRMQMARSLLTIDQDTCVRCGHCAWSCEQLHGVARLVRRGDKVVTRLRVLESSKPGRIHDLLLPNSCQHCQNPVCMIDCPTGAIGRDAAGEVFIRESLCTGCGNCAKACPWENIRMAPRKLASGAARADQFAPALIAAADRKHMALEQMFPAVATKCDLCRDYEAPACVQSCPTESLIRLEPQRDFAEVAALLGASGEGRKIDRLRFAPILIGLAATLGIATAIAGAGLHRAGALQAGYGWGLAAGVLAAATMLGLVAHAVPKRVLALWMRRRPTRARDRLTDAPSESGKLPRSRVRPFYLLHVGLGLLLPGSLLAHAGLGNAGDPVATSLLVLSWATLAIGLFGAATHALLPARLAALERRGALPEDLIHEREHLLDRLQRELSGKSSLVKRLTADFLLPWARKPFGGVAMLAFGSELREQQTLLRARIDAALPAELREHPQARAEALAGIDDCIRVAVELRALPARRLANAMLRGWLMPHVLLTGALLVALLLHVLLVTVFAAT
ncbi:cyclic nucleotide-binding domain-containing protein [Nannocystaceae bacterium ST9]